jgi:hypothetical protein
VNKIQKHVRKLQFTKGNCKVVLVHAVWGYKGEAEVYLHSILASALDGDKLMIYVMINPYPTNVVYIYIELLVKPEILTSYMDLRLAKLKAISF